VQSNYNSEGINIIESIGQLHLPPRGAEIEKDRFHYYIGRVKAEEVKHQQFKHHYKKIFGHMMDRRTKIRPMTYRQLFTEEGDLNPILFERALTRVRPESTPGYPLGIFFATNEEAMSSPLLYDCVNNYFQRLRDSTYSQLEEADPFELFTKGVLFTASAFVKGEATKASKVARLIYGASLVKTVADLILLGDYVHGVKDTWVQCEHKVGMDMYTESGKDLLYNVSYKHLRELHAALSARALAANAPLPTIVSNDVQGFEYSCSEAIHEAWYEANVGMLQTYREVIGYTVEGGFKQPLYSDSYRPDPEAVAFTGDMLLKHGLVERRSRFILFSDLELVYSHRFIRLSGLLVTHLLNSDERGLMSYMNIAVTTPLLLFPISDVGERLMHYGIAVSNMDNGDDCVEISWGRTSYYDEIGYVITDIIPQGDRLDFSSNLFFVEDGNVKRVPTNVPKIIFNLLTEPDNDESVLGMLMNLTDHPCFHDFVAILNHYRKERLVF
jgi:hypothetical protein